MKFSHALIALVAGITNALPQGQEQWSVWQQSSSIPAPAKASNAQNYGKPVGQQASPTPVVSPATGYDVGQGQWSGWQLSSAAPVASPAPTKAAIGQSNGKPNAQQASPLSVASPIPSSNLNGQQASPIPVASPALSQGAQQGQWSAWQQTSAAPAATRAAVKANAPRDLPEQNNNQAPATPIAKDNAGQNAGYAVAATGTSPSPSPNAAFQAPAADISSMLGAGPSTTCSWEFILTCASQASTAGSTCMVPMAEASTNCFSQPACAAAIGDNAATCATCFTSIGKQQFVKACYEEQSDSNVAPIFEAMVSYGVCDAQGVEIHN